MSNGLTLGIFSAYLTRLSLNYKKQKKHTKAQNHISLSFAILMGVAPRLQSHSKLIMIYRPFTLTACREPYPI